MNQIDAAEAELQQELREMFTVDTQQHLEVYFGTTAQLNPQSWTADIQQLYRAIHTIKGGAVTVSADAMLQVAIVLEDLLSDLRYLEIAPLLTDGELGRILLEAGELLSSSIEIVATGELAIASVRPTTNRLEQLRDRVKQLYLPEWNELKQVHQEFAEQGFDLVILELEMALGKLPIAGTVPAKTIESAQATIAQLTQIGSDIELAADWTTLLHHCQSLINQPDCQLWISVWFEYFELLKICIKNSGEFTAAEVDRVNRLTSDRQSVPAPTVQQATSAAAQSSSDFTTALDNFFFAEDEDLSDDLSNFFFIDEDATIVQPAAETDEVDRSLVASLDDFFLDEDATLVQPSAEIDEVERSLIASLDDFFFDEDEDATIIQPAAGNR